MIKVLVNKITGERKVVDTVTGRKEMVPNNCDKALKRIKARFITNQNKRWQNEMLRDITGTSARAARLDMGL